MGSKKECELCGREAYSFFRREIEGVILQVCADCQDYGDEPEIDRKRRLQATIREKKAAKFNSMVRPTTKAEPRMPASPYKKDKPAYSAKDRLANLRVKDNATALLLKARTKNGLSPKDFAESVFAKETYYKRIEKGSTPLPIDLARKIEAKYHITLVEEETAEEEDYQQPAEVKAPPPESMVYFRKRGQKPGYEQ